MANRLANATSPYLLQHAENPVDWWEWGPEAFAEARRRDAPILLSVGYAACHWCHVMAHESFEDEATAAYLNEHFVSIKVDREERPDVDAVYMQATQSMTGHGGWPMTVVLDHDANPFFAGTYFPDSPRHGQPAFRQVLEALSQAWRDKPDDVRRVAGRLREHLQQQVAATPGALDASVLEGVVDAAVETLAAEFDPQAAGFGGAPKFPPSMVLAFLLRHAARTGDTRSREMLDATCEAMARGGMYDQLGGGFARYAVDRDWVVPHFEKMLYDNALLLGVYAGWGGPLGERVARETAAFLLRELRTPEGGFASALDADTEGVEGRFYAWTPEQLVEVLGEDDGRWAAQVFEVTAAGTFEHGSSVLQRREDPEGPGADRLEDVRRRLAPAREDRVRPARDDKVVAAWNGLAIDALARAGALLEEPAWVQAAQRAATLLWDLHVEVAGGQARVRRVSRDGVVGAHAGVLEDHSLVAAGFLALVEATGEEVWLERAGLLLEAALAHFEAGDGGFHDTADDAEALVARPRDPSDGASPSGQSGLVHALVRYAALTGSGRHRDAAERALGTVAELARRAPRFAGWSLAAAESVLDGPREVVVVVTDPGPSSTAAGAELARWARRLPGAVSLVVTPEQAAASTVPLLAGRGLVGGRAAAYVCRGMVCERPVTDPAELPTA
jgi:uncharacterized protein YyaL (SSP411 family)